MSSTTGATAGACARALKRAGAARVDVLSLALVTDAAPVSTSEGLKKYPVNAVRCDAGHLCADRQNR